MKPSRVFLQHSPVAGVIRLVLFVAGIGIGGCAATMNLPSHWTDHKIVVDGRNGEWDITYLIDDNKLVVGLLNDSNYVYLMLATNDRPLAMSMMRGLTVWFDPKGETNKSFGIRYPLGGAFGRGNRTGGDEGRDAFQEPAPDLGMTNTEIEILGPGKNDSHRMQIMETGGIQAKVNMTGNSLVCEMRIPYRETFPFTIGVKSGAPIGIGLETSRVNMLPRNPGGEREGGEGGGMGEGGEGGYGGGGMRGGGRGGRGGMGEGGSRESMEPLDIWMKAKLLTSGETEKMQVEGNH